MVYMASASTTIRVSAATRDRLNALSARSGEPAGDVVAKLVNAADDELLLTDAAAAFDALGCDPRALAAYRGQARDIEDGFAPPTPDW